MPDIPAGKVPVIACVTASWKFFFANWRKFVLAALAPAVANGFGPMLAAPPAPGTASAGLLEDSLSGLPVTIAMIFFTAAILRKAVRDEFAGQTGLAFGQDEVRLLGVLALTLAILVPPAAIVGFGVQAFIFDRIASSPDAFGALLADPNAFTAAVVKVLGEGGLFALDVLLIALFVLSVVVLVRLSLVNAATIGERRIVFLRTWSWSRGNILRILAALLLTNLPALLASTIIRGLLVSVLAGGAATTAMPVAMVVEALSGLISAVLAIPSIALGAELYRGLKPSGFGVK